MPTAASVYFASAAGQVLAHPDGYAVLRYRPIRRQPGELATLLRQLGHLLRLRAWHRMLADNRDQAPFTAEEKAWFQAEWITNPSQVRPTPLHVALVLPTDVIARLSVLQMVHLAAGYRLHYATFTEEAAAVAYLHQL